MTGARERIPSAGTIVATERKGSVASPPDSRGRKRQCPDRRALGVVFAGFVVFFLRPGTTALAEDPCPPDAPRHVAAVEGHTWSGTVVAAAPTGKSQLGVDDWVVTFDVDRVYADRVDPDVPRQAIRAGQLFELPSNTCGRDGSMGLEVGGRYLVSTSSVSDGTAIGSIIAWKLDDDHASLVPMYKTTFIGTEFMAPESREEALTLVAPDSLNSSQTPSASIVVSTTVQPATSSGPNTLTLPSGSEVPAVVAVIAVFAAGAAASAIIWGTRRNRSDRPPGGKQ